MKTLSLTDYELLMITTSLRERTDQLRQYQSWINFRPNLELAQRAIDEIGGEIEKYNALMSNIYDQVKT